MEDIAANCDVPEIKIEDDEDDFRSCCGDDYEEVLKVSEETVKGLEEPVEKLDEFSVKMFFKGISIAGVGDSGSGFSGIGVIMERAATFPVVQVQKKLDFYVDESMADYLALMDGLAQALQHNICRVYAFTDSQLLYDQITHEYKVEIPLIVALRQRILEHAGNLEAFVLKLIPSVDLERAYHLAQVAVGVLSFPASGSKSVDNCSICCEEKILPMMITMKCSHKFCSHCMRTYVDGKVQSSQVPIKCPQLGCKYYISSTECKTFLPLTLYDSFERALAEADVLHSDGIYCPYPNCSVLLDPRECLSARASSSSQSDNSCVECPVCQRFICVDCGVPWHSSLSCEEFQNLPLDERDAADITLHRLAENKRWRRCQQCRRMIELTQGCYHMTCWCGHEFCYSCGAEYSDGQQGCQCAFWDENNSDDLVSQSFQESEQWAWETFNSLPMLMDAYSDQERSQLALIQRFLAGGFSLSDHHPYQSPPRCTDSYADAMKDLHQLPWLERFVSVISDDYYEDFIQ
ncbi:E3 ubiquitin-protein ligase RSL1 [Mercurialis annua]|uniref:E3 ubiquitin-protein ligase RSL1 n=1 Tax=Mercurialis annua TaxID=3986 RepID=UPI00216070BC|nr:E3 ubiquitin-protein ligase RSL1 [Mercurialis annua]XP_050233821.1 E3 ubiquitin-protein ligase RSL1 [Mercurialis annua]